MPTACHTKVTFPVHGSSGRIAQRASYQNGKITQESRPGPSPRQSYFHTWELQRAGKAKDALCFEELSHGWVSFCD